MKRFNRDEIEYRTPKNTELYPVKFVVSCGHLR